MITFKGGFYMVTDLNLMMLYMVRIIIVFGSAVFLLIAGILIAVSKVKPTRILGVGYIISAVATLLSQTFSLSIRFVGTESFARLSTPVSVTGFACSLMSSLCICLFIHKRYGWKFIYIPLLCLPVLSKVADLIVVKALNGSDLSGSMFGYWISLTNVVNAFVTGTVASIFVIVILLKNKEKEDLIPHAWIMKTVTFICSCITAGFLMITYPAMIARESLGKENVSVFISTWLMNYETNYMLIEIFAALSTIILPIYILIMISKASRREKAELPQI